MRKVQTIAFFVTCCNFFLHEHEKGKEIGSGWLKKVEREKENKGRCRILASIFIFFCPNFESKWMTLGY